MMKALAEFLLSFESFQKALVALGWIKSAPGPVVKSGGGPGPTTPPPPPPPNEGP